MEIAFETRLLRQICEDEDTAEQELGQITSEKLKRRLADLRAVSSINDLPAGNPRKLDGTHENKIALELCEGHYLVFCANHTSIPTLPTGKVDWEKVSRIKIMKVGSDNG